MCNCFTVTGGNGAQDLVKCSLKRCRQTDRRAAALVKDLKQLDLLNDTLVIWGGEFGGMPMLQGEVTKTVMGGDHHPRAHSIWMVGG